MRTPRTRPLLFAARLLALAVLLFLPGCGLGTVIDVAQYYFGLVGVLALLGLMGGAPCMSARNFFEFRDDFMGDRTYSATKASNVGHSYTITDTSSAGTPVYADVDGSECGELTVAFDNTNEVQNICVSQGDQLQFDIDRITEFWCRVKLTVAAPNAATSFAIGLAGDRNDAIDSIAQAALFRIIGSGAIVVETDDGTRDNDDVATGKTLADSYVELTISFACGKSDVRFFVNGQPVATGTTFDMSAYAGSLQLFAQLQKTAATATDGFVLDDWCVRGRKTLVAA